MLCFPSRSSCCAPSFVDSRDGENGGVGRGAIEAKLPRAQPRRRRPRRRQRRRSRAGRKLKQPSDSHVNPTKRSIARICFDTNRGLPVVVVTRLECRDFTRTRIVPIVLTPPRPHTPPCLSRNLAFKSFIELRKGRDRKINGKEGDQSSVASARGALQRFFFRLATPSQRDATPRPWLPVPTSFSGSAC